MEEKQAPVEPSSIDGTAFIDALLAPTEDQFIRMFDEHQGQFQDNAMQALSGTYQPSTGEQLGAILAHIQKQVGYDDEGDPVDVNLSPETQYRIIQFINAHEHDGKHSDLPPRNKIGVIGHPMPLEKARTTNQLEQQIQSYKDLIQIEKKRHWGRDPVPAPAKKPQAPIYNYADSGTQRISSRFKKLDDNLAFLKQRANTIWGLMQKSDGYTKASPQDQKFTRIRLSEDLANAIGKSTETANVTKYDADSLHDLWPQGLRVTAPSSNMLKPTAKGRRTEPTGVWFFRRKAKDLTRFQVALTEDYLIDSKLVRPGLVGGMPKPAQPKPKPEVVLAAKPILAEKPKWQAMTADAAKPKPKPKERKPHISPSEWLNKALNEHKKNFPKLFSESAYKLIKVGELERHPKFIEALYPSNEPNPAAQLKDRKRQMDNDIKQLKNLTNTLRLKDFGHHLKASGYKHSIKAIEGAVAKYVSDKEKEILAPAQPKAPPKREPPKKQPHVQATNKKEPFKAPTFDEIMDIGLFKGLIDDRKKWKPNWSNREIDDELHVTDKMSIPARSTSAGHELQRIIQDVLLEPLLEMTDDVKPLPYTTYYRVSDLDKLEVARKSMYRTVNRHLKERTGQSGGPGDILGGIDRIKYVQKNLQVAKRLLDLLRVPNDILNSGDPTDVSRLMKDQTKGMSRRQRKEF